MTIIDKSKIPQYRAPNTVGLFWIKFGLSLIFISTLFDNFIIYFYGSHQYYTFWLVFLSFISPILTPFFILKELIIPLFPPSFEQHIVYSAGRFLFTPSTPFSLQNNTYIPDYSDLDNWACYASYPSADSCTAIASDATHCSQVTINNNTTIKNLCDAVDVFYLGPTTWYTAQSWNAPPKHQIPQYLHKDAISIQQVGAFNIVGRIFVPLFRQMSAAGFLIPQHMSDPNYTAALDLAYSDVRRAFKYYLANENAPQGGKRRGIILAGHSQGSILAERLIDEFFINKPLGSNLVAAYLVGWTVFRHKYSDLNANSNKNIRVCESKDQINCVISWRTFGFGGDHSLFLYVNPPTIEQLQQHDRPICTNPLSWTENDGVYVGHEHNLGGFDLMHPWSMWNYLMGMKDSKQRMHLPTKTEAISDAVCKDGSLWITLPRMFGYGWGVMPIWRFAMFPGRNMHTYDYNLFYYNIRQNAVDRTLAYLELHD